LTPVRRLGTSSLTTRARRKRRLLDRWVRLTPSSPGRFTHDLATWLPLVDRRVWSAR